MGNATLLSPQPLEDSMWTEEHRDWEAVDYGCLKEWSAFPKEFMWGVATASHQIEGGNTNNLSAFEPRSKSQQLSGDACDHWNRREEDVTLIKELGVSHYRFSIEWSRIEPQEGQFDSEAIQWYSDLVDELLIQGIQPMATLHHFTQPLWWDER